MSILAADYGKVVDASERVAWRVNEVFPPGSALDYTKWFMPKAMFVAKDLEFLSEDEKRKLNQIYGNSYAYLFYFVEAYIIDMAMRHAQAELYGSDENNLRAMLRFAEEEVKHQQMFIRFGEMFKASFGTPCDVVPNPQAVAAVILSKSPMAVTLVTLHLEIITQAHYVECMRDDKEMDPQFANLFKHHWVEESQHAKLDVLELTKLRRDASPEQVQQCVDDYFAIAGAFAGLLGEQAKLDVVSFERALGKTFSAEEREAIETAQRKTYHRTFLRSGVTNSMFLEFLAEHFPAALPGCAQAAEAFA
jgi:hypothetical protein